MGLKKSPADAACQTSVPLVKGKASVRYTKSSAGRTERLSPLIFSKARSVSPKGKEIFSFAVKRKIPDALPEGNGNREIY